MKQLKVIERNNERVLTSAQLAEVLGTDTKTISYNFNYNKARYEEGKHYFVLQGDDLKDFKSSREFPDESKQAHTIYLWTAKGALLHVKSLGTDKAWSTYLELVDDYFKKVEEAKQPTPQQDLSSMSPQLQFLFMMEQRQNAFETKQTQLENRMTGMEEVKDTVATIANSMIKVPDHTIVVSTINEYARWTRLGHNEVYNKAYDILKKMHGIDVKQRVENERNKAQEDYHKRTGKYYSEATLKGRVNGVDVMVRLGCLDKFHSIVVGMLSREKIKSKLSVVAN